MKVLVVGSGGRESALCWALSKDRSVEGIWCAPGNAGTASIARNLSIESSDRSGIAIASWEKHVDLVVVGPEAPLAGGLADMLRAIGIPVFGPSQKAAQIESSKVFCKELLAKYRVPTAPFMIFDEASKAHSYAEHCPLPVVMKADGLAQGKGVVVAKTRREAHEAIERFMVEKVFGKAGDRILVETFLEGRECSFMVVSDGEFCLPFPPARDYKRARENDQGPNTGGMGAYAPLPDATPAMRDWCMEHIIKPTIAAMAKEGHPFTGALYAGLMLTAQGPMVLEFNARFGDPETQAVLPLLASDNLGEILMAGAKHFTNYHLADVKAAWSDRKSVCVNLVSEGYPGSYKTGRKIEGLGEAAQNTDVLLFHAGTASRGDKIVTQGGQGDKCCRPWQGFQRGARERLYGRKPRTLQRKVLQERYRASCDRFFKTECFMRADTKSFIWKANPASRRGFFLVVFVI